MQLNVLGEIVKDCLMEIPHLFANVEIPVHAIMRNHLHSILVLRDINPSSDDRFFRPAKTKTPAKNILRGRSVINYVLSLRSATPNYPALSVQVSAPAQDSPPVWHCHHGPRLDRSKPSQCYSVEAQELIPATAPGHSEKASA